MPIWWRTLAVALLVQLAAGSGFGASIRRFRIRNSGNQTLALRKRLHVDPLIAEPGTGEVDWGSLYSISSGNYSMPSVLKWTPEGTSLPWGRTEYSVSFDSLTSAPSGSGRLTQFSEALTLAATTVVLDGEHLDVAIAPQSTVFLRDERGVRLGATAIARYDQGYKNVAVTAGWSGATHSSDNNPAGTFDLGMGTSRQFGRWTPHFNAVYEKSTGVPQAVSLFEGVEFQYTDRVAFDLSGQHFGAVGGPADHQLVFGVAVALGHAH